MIFWIATAIVLAALIWGIWFAWWDSSFETVIGGILGSIGFVLLAAVVWMFLMMIVFSVGSVTEDNPAMVASETRSDLVALGTESSVEGRFYFLGGGWIDGKRVFNYTVDHGAYYTAEQVDASVSRVYDDEDDAPYVIARSWRREMPWWLAPGSLNIGSSYDFHIPEGSVVREYEVGVR